MTKKKFSLVLLSLIVAFSVAFGLISVKPLDAKADTDITYSFSYDSSKGSTWINKDVFLPSELVENGVADMSKIKAMVYEVDNTNQPAFAYTLGIRDNNHNQHDNEWLMEQYGSALLVPEKGHPYWANTHWVPAGFKGTVVIPWSTTTYDWSSNTRYKTINNPVFKTRYSTRQMASNKEMGKGYYYTDGSKGTFPSSTMNNYMTFYVHNDWNKNTNNITFNNIRFVEDYDTYLAKAATYDSASIGAVSNQISMDGATAFNGSGAIAPHYKQQSGGGTSATSLDNNVGLAIRIKNMSSKTINLELKINESSSEVLFISNQKPLDIPFIHLDGTVESIKAQGSIKLPADYDGTVIVPNTAWALANDPNKPADLNGRLHGNMWALFLFSHDIGVEQTFAIAEINQIYASYNTSTQKTEYTLKPMKTVTNGTDVNYVKNPSSWGMGNNGTIYTLGEKVAVNLVENLDGEVSTENLASVNKTSVYSKEIITLNASIATGRVIESVLVDGVDKTVDLIDGENLKSLIFTNPKESGELNVIVNYKTAFYVTYDLDGGINDSRNPTMYDKSNKGETAIPVYPAIKANYRFLGWFNRVEFSHPDAFEIKALDYDFFTSKGYNDADIKLYAAYVTDYVVNVVAGETVTPITLSMGSGLYLENLADFDEEGYSETYYIDDAFTTEITFPYYANSHDTNIYVKYDKNEYSVRFQSLGGTNVSSQTVKYGDKAVEPSVPVREGYRFDGWFTNDDYDLEFNFNGGIYEDTVIYAKWTYVKDANTAKTLTTVIIINSIVTVLGLGVVGFIVIPKLKKK